MVNGSKFELTLSKTNYDKKVREILKLYDFLYSNYLGLYEVTLKDNIISIDCSSKETAYPLEVLTNMILYRMSKMDMSDANYYLFSLENMTLLIKPHQIYIGK